MRTYLMLLAGLALLSCTGKKPSEQSHLPVDTAEALVVAATRRLSGNS